VIAIFIALVADGLDGRVARWTNSQSEMGAQLDSLADMVSFGVAPAILIYSWSLSVLGKLGWLVAFIYMVCTALRLARFNSLDQSEEKRYFYGLNTPSAAALVVSTLWVFTVFGIQGHSVAILMAILMFVVGFLKVSSIKYRSFKDLDTRNKVSLKVVLLVVLVFVLIVLRPPETLFLIIFAYVISGPIGFICLLFRRKKNDSTK
jgi:CDP-diacylglycerol---serine O-phosphatidyltransferase